LYTIRDQLLELLCLILLIVDVVRNWTVHTGHLHLYANYTQVYNRHNKICYYYYLSYLDSEWERKDNMLIKKDINFHHVMCFVTNKHWSTFTIIVCLAHKFGTVLYGCCFENNDKTTTNGVSNNGFQVSCKKLQL
jgi:hypothetical protein